jgi:hypothetical protein
MPNRDTPQADMIQEAEGESESSQADEPKQPATASPKSSGGGAASPEPAQARKKPRTQPASPHNGDMVSVASKVSQAEKSQTSHTSSGSSSRGKFEHLCTKTAFYLTFCPLRLWLMWIFKGSRCSAVCVRRVAGAGQGHWGPADHEPLASSLGLTQGRPQCGKQRRGRWRDRQSGCATRSDLDLWICGCT